MKTKGPMSTYKREPTPLIPSRLNCLQIMTIALARGRSFFLLGNQSGSFIALATVALVVPSALAQVDAVSVRFEPGCEQVKAYFDNTVSNATSYSWDFGDGTTSTLASPISPCLAVT